MFAALVVARPNRDEGYIVLKGAKGLPSVEARMARWAQTKATYWAARNARKKPPRQRSAPARECHRTFRRLA